MIEDERAKEIYLDYAAATPIANEVLEAMTPYWSERFYNPSAPYVLARNVRADYEAARARLAHVVGGRPGNVTLTAGATEANNLALASVKGHVLACATEHESVLERCANEGGRFAPVTKDGTIDIKAFKKMLTDDVELVSLGLANGEIGTIQPVREVASLVRKERMRRLEAGETTPLLLHTDASQAAGFVSVNVSSLGVDLMTLSAAKVYGPKQVGMLWHADGIALRSLVQGGGQEGGVRSGTENVAGVIGFARALELAEGLRSTEVHRLRKLTLCLRRLIVEGVPDVVFSGPTQESRRLPGLVHASFPETDARRLVIALERRGVCVGTGSACAASRMRTSHVLKAIGMSNEVAQGSLRMSLGRATSDDDIKRAAAAIVECVCMERSRMAKRRERE